MAIRTHTFSVLSLQLQYEETKVTRQVSHRYIKCQSRLWSQRGAKVNGSYHGDSPLLRPIEIQIATKSYATLQAMAPTSVKTATPYREQPRSTRIVVAYPRPAFSATKRTNYAPISFDQQLQVSQGHIVMALKAEVWVEAVTEGGRRFMAAWRKEEQDAARHRQEKREATGLGKLLLHTEA